MTISKFIHEYFPCYLVHNVHIILRYLGCVGEHMKSLKPFGDVPDKLSVILKRSFVATRTYAQALNIASEITRNLQNVSKKLTFSPNFCDERNLLNLGTCYT